MKKTTNMSKRLLALLLTIAMLASLIVPSAIVVASADAQGYTRNTSWDYSGSTLHITSAEDLLQFIYLADKTTNFSGKTIYLDCDIDLNPGWSAEVTVDTVNSKLIYPSAPATEWTNAGTTVTTGKMRDPAQEFAGTFDGQGHTISGIYSYRDTNDEANHFGLLFNKVNGGKVKNLAVTNSLIYWTSKANNSESAYGGLMGGIKGASTVENLYTDLTIVMAAASGKKNSLAFGGITGWVGGTTTLRNCVFAGSILTANAYQGDTYPATGVTWVIGGVAGEQEGGTTSNLLGMPKTVLVSVPSVAIQAANQQNAYNTTGGGYNAVIAGHYGNDYGTRGATVLEGAQSAAPAGSDWKYAVALGSYVPAYIEETFFDVTTPDTSWYDSSLSEFTLYNRAQLLGFFQLLATDSGSVFNGKTVKLGADIDLNPGWDLDVTYNAGFNIPAAPYNTIYTGDKIKGNASTGRWFFGTFDGQGHTISGIYSSYTFGSDGCLGANAAGIFGNLSDGTNNGIVKNLAIVNSYIEYSVSSKDSPQMSGIASCLRGSAKILNCYFDVDILMRNAKDQKSYIGVISCYGSVSGSNNAELKNVVYNGIVGVTNGQDSTAYRDGTGATTQGRIGFFYQNANNVALTAQNVLNSGLMYSNMSADAGNGYSENGQNGGSIAKTNCKGSFAVKSNNAYKQTEAVEGWKYVSTLGSYIPGTVADTFFANAILDECEITISASNATVTIYDDDTFTGGTATNSVTVFEGTPVYFTVTPNEGYAVSGTPTVTGTYTAITAASGVTNGYVITGVASDLTVAATVAESGGGDEPGGGSTPSAGESVLTTTATPDISWYNTTDTVFTIDTAEKLLGFAQLLADDTDGSLYHRFDGQTFNLTVDVDLNYGANLGALVADNIVTLPSTPANVWPRIPYFGGTFNGGGHTIKGVYLYAETTQTTSGPGSRASMFGTISGGSVTDLVIKNSIILLYKSSSAAATTNFRVGGLADNIWKGDTDEGVLNAGESVVIRNVYVDIDVVALSDKQTIIGGIAAVAYPTTTIENVVYRGNIIHADLAGTGLTSNSSTLSSQFVAASYNDSGDASLLVSANGILALGDHYTYDAKTGQVTTRTGGYDPFARQAKGWEQSNAFSSHVTSGAPEGWVWSDVLSSYAPATLAGYLAAGAGEINVADDEPIANYSDDDGSGSSYVIASLEDLNFFVGLANSKDLTGKTFKLTADIVVNADFDATDTATWLNTTPTNVWTPIDDFNGTFDGNGHSISGIFSRYDMTTKTYVKGGIFTKLSGTVKNLVIKNSFLALNKVSGDNSVDNIFGGIAGEATGAVIENCYFDIEVFYKVSGARDFGALFGKVNGATVSNTVLHGTFGQLKQSGAYNSYVEGSTATGWIAGRGSNVEVTDMLISMRLGVPTSNMGSSTQTLVHWDNTNITSSGVYFGKQTDAIDGWTFDDALASFTPTTLTIAAPSTAYVARNRVDKSMAWLDSRDTGSYFITSLAEFKAFGDYAKSMTCNGQTFKLTVDIDLNNGWNADASISSNKVTFPSAPAYTWTAINNFQGTFDGQGHCISGFYRVLTKSDDSNFNEGGIFNTLSGTVQNLAITNSFFALYKSGGSGSENKAFGGLAGTSSGATISNVVFNAEVWYKGDVPRRFGNLFSTLSGSGVTINDLVVAGRFASCKLDGTYCSWIAGSTPTGIIAGHGSGATVNISDMLHVATIGVPASNMGSNQHNLVHWGPGTINGTDTLYWGLQETDCPDGWAWDDNLLSYSPATVSAKYLRMDVDQPLSKFNGTAKVGSSYIIANYQDMLNFMQKINASDGKGAGYIFKLTADVDLNPGWRAMPTITGTKESGTIQVPAAPETTWQITSFKGTFDGQGHYVAGLYRAKLSAIEWDKIGGFCDWLDDAGAIKNTKFINGLVIANSGKPNVRLGGLVGMTTENNTYSPTIENVYVDMHVWGGSWGGFAVGGIVAQPAHNVKITNVTFVGTVGQTKPSDNYNGSGTIEYPTTSGKMSVGQIFGDSGGRTGCAITNVVAAGTAYYPSSSDRCREIFALGVDTVRAESTYPTVTNVLVGKYATLVAAQNANAITGQDNPAYTYQDFGTEGFLVVTSNYNMGLTGMPDGRPTIQSIQDYTGNEYPDSVYTIANAGDLLYAAELSQSGVTFNGYILRLTADVDLNPGWSAHVTIDPETSIPTIPLAPTVVFPGFKDFYGTLDGQDHTISGVAMYKVFTAQDNLAFIERLYGTVTNIKFNNSLIYAETTNYNQSDSKIAGIAARIQSASATIENVYVGTEVWVRSGSAHRIGGIAGKTENGAHLDNIVFAGVVGTIKFVGEGGIVPSQSTGTSVSQLVADGNWKSALYISNCSMNGVIYADASIDVTRPIFSNINSANVQNPLQDATYTGSTYVNNVPAFNIFPDATVDRNHASYEADTTTKTYYFEDITRANFTAYINTLKAAGYTVEQEYSISDNAYVLLQNGVYTVFASRITSNGYTNGEKLRARVYVEPYGRDYNTQKEATAKSTYCAAQLWQVNVDNWYSKSSGGACYVMRLTDGRYIVVDSGFGSKPEYRNLYKILYENNVRDGNPIIAAWFFTHGHEDHVKGFERLVKEGEYKNDLTIEAVYFNFPSHEVVADEDAGDGLSLQAISTFQNAATASKGTKVYNRIHTGMSFGFADATVTVLYTHEDAAQSYWNGTTLYENHLNNGNDTSTMYKVTIGSETILFTGDAYIGAENATVYTYAQSVMASKFVTVSHHGYEGLSKTFYQKVGASVALWPMDVVGYTQEETAQPLNYEFTFNYRYNHTHSGNRMWEANQWIKNNSQEVIPAFENACLTLPYTAKTYSGGSKTVNITSVYNTKAGSTANWDGSGKGTEEIAIDEWYDAEADELYINNRKDLFDFMKAGQKYNFYGKTVILNADISVNPSWSYSGLLDNNFLVDAPDGLSEWKPIKSFAGTFDGQGHTIRNLYIPISVSNGTYNGGFFASVYGGAVIENLIVKSSAMVAKYDVTQGTASTKIGGFIGRIADNTGEDGPAVLTNLYIDLDVYYQSQSCAALAGLVGTLAQVEYTNPEYDADEAEAQGDNYEIPQKLTRSASFVIQDVVYAGDLVVVAKNGQAGGAIYLASGQQMWGPVGFIGSSPAAASYETDLTREITNALYLGTRIHTSSGSKMGADIVSNHEGFRTPIYNDEAEENPAGAITLTDAYGGVQTGEIEGWSMNDDLGTLLPDAVNEMLAAVVKPAVAQQSAEYTLTGTNTKAVDIRFIGVLTGILDEADLGNYSEVGMIITSKRGDQVLFTTEMTTTTVYESLQAGDDLYDMNDAGGFLYAFVIRGVTLNAEVDFYITTFTVDSDTSKPMEERRVNNEEVKFAFDGGLTINTAE